jgi:ATP-dependent protease HslVU (ClpYQ) ATPase subunit
MLTLTVEQALKEPVSGLNVLIIGMAGSGKTWFANQLSAKHQKSGFIQTDDYIQFGWEQSMYVVLGEVVELIEQGTSTIVEGVAGYRMLRKGAELGSYFPDIVFEMIAPESQINEVYRMTRDAKKVANLPAFAKMNQTVLEKYKAMSVGKEPRWIRVNNIFDTTILKNQ